MTPKNYRSEIGDRDCRLDPGGDAARLVVAGLSGDAGKTLVSLALLFGFRDRGIGVRAFKKGPDYIDAAWLAWASQHPARNLDTWLAGFASVRAAFATHTATDGINLVEGNRGVFDGVDAEGTHSTAELAKTLQAPVILVLDARKATRTLAACVLGCQTLDPALEIAGVVLNRVAGVRHESVARQAIEGACGVKVVGTIPRLEGEQLPGRHMGLVPPGEHEAVERVRALALTVAARHLDLDALVEIARRAGSQRQARPRPEPRRSAFCANIGYLRDSAFNFYYPENLEALEDAGAELTPISSLDSAALPAGLDALYIGGGFPETHAVQLAANRTLLGSLRCGAESGLPIYAECGGLMLLARALRFRGDRHEMAGVLPFDVEVCERPQGHGYSTLVVDRPNSFFQVGTVLKGHEFHYSRLAGDLASGTALHDVTACAVERGTGCGLKRDAIAFGSVWAAYTHLHAGSTPDWARGLVRAAAKYRNR
jgi:cobyrinic acid a,c-diamide synthase